MFHSINNVGAQSDTERKVWMEKYANVEVTEGCECECVCECD